MNVSVRVGRRRVGMTAVVMTGVVLSAGLLAPAAAAAQPAGCGEATSSPSDTTQLVALSAPRPAGEQPSPRVLEDRIARLDEIANILVRQHDRSGLFTVGLAVTEHDAVLPLEEGSTGLRDPARMQAISVHLLDRYLAAVHARYSGADVPEHWRNYFRLAADCSVLGQRAAMAGYNAHITVDLADAVAESGATQADAPDFYRLVDTIAAHASSIAEVTRDDYGVDLGPALRFYFLGEGLDRIVGAGNASQPMLRAADVGYNVATFTNGLVLEDPTTRPTARTAVTALWSTGESALTVADRLGVLSLP